MMRDRIGALLDRYAALSGRERLLIVIAIFAVAYQLADLVVLDRQFQRIEQVNREIAGSHTALRQVSAELNSLATQAQADPNTPVREQVERTRHQLDVSQRQLRELTGDLISPQDMARFLEELLVQEEELTMLRLETLDAKPLLSADHADRGGLDRPALHRHGFEIEFSGSYLATLRYLEALEALPWRFFWDSVHYEVLDYPASVVRLKLHTLSLSEDWIGV